MEGLVFFLGVIGNIISVLMFLSPAKTFVLIVNGGSTEEFSSLPYICTLLNSSLWTYYGLTKPDSYLVATVNGFGVLVELVYVALFLIYASPSKRAKTAIMFGVIDVGFLGAAISTTYMLLQGDVRITAIGSISAALNILMYASPLAAMKRVVRTRSVEYMPFLLSFFLFLNGGVWAFYAILTEDWFLGVPNGIGLGLGTLQLAIYAIYNCTTKPSTTHSLAPHLHDKRHTDPLLTIHEDDEDQC